MLANHFPHGQSLGRARTILAASMALTLAACSSVSLGPRAPEPAAPPAPAATENRATPTPAQAGAETTPPSPASPAQAAAARPRPSSATDPRAYRHDAARHVYEANRERIYTGKLPPMLYAIGVLDVELDGQGHVRGMHWQRAPRHAPEVIAEIERTVRAAAPYPAPARMGRVVYTDVWLWDRSGRFQLDTLTEGQR